MDASVRRWLRGLIEMGRKRREAAALLLSARPPEFYFLPGFWITFPDGRVRFEWKSERDGRVVVTVRADRVSLEVLRSRH